MTCLSRLALDKSLKPRYSYINMKITSPKTLRLYCRTTDEQHLFAYDGRVYRCAHGTTVDPVTVVTLYAVNDYDDNRPAVSLPGHAKL